MKTEQETKTYIGLTSMEFKKRFYQHRSDFIHRKNKDSTRLSSHIWKLKDNKTDFKINWEIVKKVGKIRNGDKICRVCTRDGV